MSGTVTSVVRIWSDAEGGSHFEDIEVHLAPRRYAPPAGPIDVSDPFSASGAMFFSMPGGWFGDWHPTPRRQFCFILSGSLEVHVTDGQVRQFEPGAIVLLEDVTALGHSTRVIGDRPSTGVFVHLADGATLA